MQWYAKEVEKSFKSLLWLYHLSLCDSEQFTYLLGKSVTTDYILSTRQNRLDYNQSVFFLSQNMRLNEYEDCMSGTDQKYAVYK